MQGEASLTVNTQRLDNQQNGTLYSAADLTLDIPDIRNSGLITGDNGLTLNTASLSNPGKITADTLNVRATTLDGDGLLQGAGALALAGDTLSQGRNGRWLTAGDPLPPGENTEYRRDHAGTESHRAGGQLGEQWFPCWQPVTLLLRQPVS
ncbi:hemagglutinin-related protein [Escherichia coli]|uniref:Hemagglutinin-related protein n=1 Tax=Escherichia coli TaxID=562 RepID=A0A377K8Z6_ECOLX|nr:hemagglutinin-related protein [Escherichia coli]